MGNFRGFVTQLSLSPVFECHVYFIVFIDIFYFNGKIFKNGPRMGVPDFQSHGQRNGDEVRKSGAVA
jgi:hypothetical protein